MRNNSQKAGCMRRFPASHSCHPRSVQWMSAAAAVCESPAASRAARTCSGAGLAEGAFAPRFGWLGTLGRLEGAGGAVVAFMPEDLIAGVVGADFVEATVPVVLGQHCFNGCGVLNEAARGVEGDFSGIGGGHFRLLPLFLPRRGGLRCATHELNYTRNACNSKKYFREHAEAGISPHNAKLTGDPQPHRGASSEQSERG